MNTRKQDYEWEDVIPDHGIQLTSKNWCKELWFKQFLKLEKIKLLD